MTQRDLSMLVTHGEWEDLQAEVSLLSDALQERVLEGIRKGKNISKLNAEMCLLQAEVARLNRLINERDMS